VELQQVFLVLGIQAHGHQALLAQDGEDLTALEGQGAEVGLLLRAVEREGDPPDVVARDHRAALG
jgi:hypothetical protein